MIKRSRTPQAAANRTELSETTVLNYDTTSNFRPQRPIPKCPRAFTTPQSTAPPTASFS